MREQEFLLRYNKTIVRYKKALEFLEADYYIDKKTKERVKYKSIDEEFEKKEKWFDEFNKIVRELSLMLKEYKLITGQEMKEEEKFNGFALT